MNTIPRIPLVDLARIHRALDQEILNTITRVIEKGDFIQGSEVTRFEDAFAAFCKADFAIGVASGTDALHLALKAVGIGPGDTVITAANTFIATALAINFTGANLLLIDVDEDTSNITPQGLESAIRSAGSRGAGVKALVPVHLYGRPCPMDNIMAVADMYDLHVVEDACQAHGAEYSMNDVGQNGKAGTFGDAGCFSFYPGKNLGGLGDGGMVVTNDSEIAGKVRLLGNYGSKKKYFHLLKGGNSRLDTLQAAVLLVKLAYLDQWNYERQQVADCYREMIEDLPELTRKIILPAPPEKGSHVYHLFVVRVAERDRLLAHLNSSGIGAGVHYPVPIHLQQAFQDLGYRKGDFPVTERLAEEILSLPIFPGMTRDEIATVVREIQRFYSK